MRGKSKNTKNNFIRIVLAVSVILIVWSRLEQKFMEPEVNAIKKLHILFQWVNFWKIRRVIF